MCNIDTQIIEALSHSNARSEFRLDWGKQYKNLRVVGLGCTTQALMAKYTDNAGVYGLINNMYLMDGHVIIDQLLECNKYFSHDNLRQNSLRDNGFDYSVSRVINGGSRSFQLDTVGGVLIQHIDNPEQWATTDVATTFRGSINLTRVFNILASLEQGGSPIDTTIMPNLRVVIEWNTDILNVFQSNPAVVSLTVLAPQLLADVVTVPVQMPESVVFVSHMLEKHQLTGGGDPGDGNRVPSKTEIRSMAFNGKIINKLMLQNVDYGLDAGTAGDALKSNCSKALNGELVQVQLNGTQLLNFNGCDTDARKLNNLNTAGTYNIPQTGWRDGYLVTGGTKFATNAFKSLFPETDGAQSNYANSLVGKNSYMSLYMGGQRVEDLKISHTRNLTHLDFSQLMLYMWGDVLMQVTFGKQGYNVTNL